MKKYIRVIKPAPILNTPNFLEIFGGKDKNTLKVDEKGHIRALEFVGLKDMVFEVVSVINEHIYKIKTSIYSHENLFIDKRFTTPCSKDCVEPTYQLNPKIIIKKLLELENMPYIWGGNWSQGINDMLTFYPPKDHDNTILWALKGIDCSGLLFEVTNGYTPRNTQELLSWGSPLDILNKTPQQITNLIKPLDLIVFKGHIIIALNSKKTIESKENQGVIITSCLNSIKKLCKEKKPVNNWEKLDNFVIRRWIS